MRRFLALSILVVFLALGVAPVRAAEDPVAPVPEAVTVDAGPPDEYFRGTVIAVLGEATEGESGLRQTTQRLKVRIDSGKEKGAEVASANSYDPDAKISRRVSVGTKVVVVKSAALNEETGDFDQTRYIVADFYRLPLLGLVLLAFFLLVLYFGKKRGLMSFLGLLFSGVVIVWYVVPGIIAGRGPLSVILVGALAIVCVSLFLAHGMNVRTGVAFVGTLLTLCGAAALATVVIGAGKLFGAGTEDAIYLQSGGTTAINIQGLLLGGIIIGMIGVLDDVTTGQSAAVDEIAKADPSLPFAELYRRGISVGNEHIASLVNTLVLTYAGVSLPLFLLFTLYRSQPLWALLNGEIIAEEVARTLLGSIALVLAVPLTTAIAAAVFSDRRVKKMRATADVRRAHGPGVGHHH
jgi:uncharacterized membrane protein